MKKIAIVVEAPDEAGAVECVIHRRAGDGSLLPAESAPYRVMTPLDVLALFAQIADRGLIEQKLSRLDTGEAVWGPVRAELRITPKWVAAQGNGKGAESTKLIVPAGPQIILPGQ